MSLFQASPSLRRFGKPLWVPVAGSVLVQWGHRCLQVLSWWLNLEVTSGWWSVREASLAFTASVLLAMGRGLLHFRSLLSVSTFVVFAATSTAVVSLDLRGTRFTHPDLRRPGISPVDGEPPTSSLSSLILPSPHLLRMGEEDLVSWVSAHLAVLSSLPALLVLPALLFRRETL